MLDLEGMEVWVGVLLGFAVAAEGLGQNTFDNGRDQ